MDNFFFNFFFNNSVDFLFCVFFLFCFCFEGEGGCSLGLDMFVGVHDKMSWVEIRPRKVTLHERNDHSYMTA